MAAPANKTIRDLNGTWKLNKTLSDSPEPTLTLQGVPWVIRKGIIAASMVISVKQYSTPTSASKDGAVPSQDPIVHIDIETSLSGLKGTREERAMDGSYQQHEDWLFGKVKARSEFIDTTALQGSVKNEVGVYSTEGWIDESEYIASYVERLDGAWTASQIWGFAMIDGQRRHVRKIKVAAGDKNAAITFVYDFVK